MTRLLLSLVLIAGSIATVHGEVDADTEIRALIQAVAESECEFNRNGSLHSAEAAAEHLQLKYSRGSVTLTPLRRLLSAWRARVPGAASPIR